MRSSQSAYPVDHNQTYSVPPTQCRCCPEFCECHNRSVVVSAYSSLKVYLTGLDVYSDYLLPAPMSVTLAQFRQKIEDLRQRAANQRYYIDPKALQSLCTHELVLHVVKECNVPRHSQEERAKTITAIGFVTFSILVYIGQERLIVKFLESDMFNKLDDRLPMNMDELDTIAPGQLKRFEEHQWQFRPVILERDTYKNIGDKFIIPFKEDVRNHDSDGSFGKIYTVTFEAAMQKLLPAAPTEVEFVEYVHSLQANSSLLNRLPPPSKYFGSSFLSAETRKASTRRGRFSSFCME